MKAAATKSVRDPDYVPPIPTSEDPMSVPAPYSEDHLALLFTERYGAELRYVKKFNEWLRWDGRKWGEEATMLQYDLARSLCR